MTKLPIVELDKLLNRIVDGIADEVDEKRLAEFLRSDASARRYYRDFMALHADLQWDYAVAASQKPDSAEREDDATAVSVLLHGGSANGNRPPILAYAWIGTTVVVLALVMGSLFFTNHDHPENTIVELDNISGSITWSNGVQDRRSGLTDGMKLPAGTITTEGESATVQVRFADGTMVFLSGKSELVYSDDGQKRLELRHGSLTAGVRPQPVDSPMLIRTSTAEVEVLGTILSVLAEEDETKVNVESGKVLLKRLADGRCVTVSRNHSASASLSTSDEMTSRESYEPSDRWRRTYDTPPTSNSKGQYCPPNGSAPGYVEAVPCWAGREADGTPIIHHGVTARELDGRIVKLRSDSVFTIRYRVDKPVYLRVMLSTQKPDGWFGGNFEMKLSSEDMPVDADGWSTFSIPVSEFPPLESNRIEYSEPPADGYVSLIFVATTSNDSGLDVSELFIASPTR